MIRAPLDIVQDVATGVVTINGQPYSIELFERMALIPKGGDMLIVQRDSATGCLTCTTKPAAQTFA